MQRYFYFLAFLIFIGTGCLQAAANPVRHYVFFGMDREKIKATKVLYDSPVFEGAQVAYSWNQLEHEKDKYDFSLIREDLKFLSSKGKKLFIQIQDVSFNEKWVLVPKYLRTEPAYNGGVVRHYKYEGGTDNVSTPLGWMPRRWDPAVNARFHKLLAALGKEFDGRIAGINLEETSFEVGSSGKSYPAGFTPESYRDGIVSNMKALRQAFQRSDTIIYANFMPGEWRPTGDKGLLTSVYAAAREQRFGVGGPDLLPYQPGQMGSSYGLIRDLSGIVPTGIAFQDGNGKHRNPKTGKQTTIAEFHDFANDYLKVGYIFWGIEEPYFSESVVPLLKQNSTGKSR